MTRPKLADFCEAHFIRAYAANNNAAMFFWARCEYAALYYLPTYRRVGGLHFVKIGKFGMSFYVSRR